MLVTVAFTLDETHVAYLDRLAALARDGKRSRSWVLRRLIDERMRDGIDWPDSGSSNIGADGEDGDAGR